MELPEPIIQRIQSFLTGREAAVTAVLSKSWCRAWLTRPDIDLDENDFFPGAPGFPELVKKTIQRYEEANLKIRSFSLCMGICASYDGTDLSANNLILKALTIGPAHLNLRLRSDYGFYFVLPNEVFAAENLVQLSVEGCIVDPDPSLRCSGLESLTLSEVGVECNVIPNIISCCPLIKHLSLSKLYDNEYYSGKGTGLAAAPIGFPKFNNIRCLVLSCLQFDILFLGDLSTKFPSLKDLTLNYSSIFPEDIRVSSRSLELLNFTTLSPTMRVEFDVPSIRKFTFDGPLIESLSFKPISREWESRLRISCHGLSTSWFIELNKLAAQFSQSKLHLTCCIYTEDIFDYEVEELQGLPKFQVENLTMFILGVPSSTCFALFDGLFRICHPKLITQHLFPTTMSCWQTNNTFLCKMLVQQINEKCSVESIAMHSLHDLKQVSLQVFDMDEWQDIPLKSLLDASACQKTIQTIRFGLEWRA